MGAVTAGLKPATIEKAIPYAVGATANMFASRLVAAQEFTPEILKSGPGRIVLSLLTAGVTGLGAGMVKKGWTGPVVLGGVIEAVLTAMQEYVVPVIPGLKGLEDYLDMNNVRNARSLGCVGCGDGMGDFLDMNNVRNARALGEYMPNTEASELAGMGQNTIEQSISDWRVPDQWELSPMLQGMGQMTIEQAVNDWEVPDAGLSPMLQGMSSIDGVAAMELGY